MKCSGFRTWARILLSSFIKCEWSETNPWSYDSVSDKRLRLHFLRENRSSNFWQKNRFIGAWKCVFLYTQNVTVQHDSKFYTWLPRFGSIIKNIQPCNWSRIILHDQITSSFVIRSDSPFLFKTLSFRSLNSGLINMNTEIILSCWREFLSTDMRNRLRRCRRTTGADRYTYRAVCL